jgi:sulfatase maturation enzyme AslB (radical SAM superfamily)
MEDPTAVAASELGSTTSSPDEESPLVWKLWIYTNYDCNLSCTYCVAESSPRAPRRGIGLETVKQLVDESVGLGFRRLFFTGGEPFILDDIYEMLAYASARAKTTVLTNAMLLHGSRLDCLVAVASDNLVVQVSLDGARPEHHDAYRGPGTWSRTVEAIRRLQKRGLRLRLSTTETPANSGHLEELHAFRRSLGITADDHVIRPLARRGFASQGLEVGVDCLVPEVTVTSSGVFWHPLASPSSTDMQVSDQIFPLATAIDCIRSQFVEMQQSREGQAQAVT